MKVIFLCSGAGSRMKPLSDLYPKSLIPVPQYHNGSGNVPNLYNSIEVLYFSPLGRQIDEAVVVASPEYFKRDDYLKIKERSYLPITEIINRHADWPHLNNQHTMRLALSHIKECDSVMVVEGDIYLRNVEDYLPVSLEGGHSYYCCSYRNSEWVFVNRHGSSHYDIVKGANGLAMAGLSIVNGADTVRRLRETLDQVTDPGEFWDESLMRLNLPLKLINVDDAIVEFDTVVDLINEGLYTPEELASVISEDNIVESTDSMTNTSFIVKYNGVKSVLRLPGPGTEEFINRQREKIVQKFVNEQAGCISPKSISYGSGIKIAEFVEGCRTSEEKDAHKVMSLLKEFHQVKTPLEGLLVNLIDEVGDYEKLYNSALVSIPQEYDEVAAVYKSLISSFQYEDVVLCHRDLDPRNILIRDDEGFLVDFEYSGLLNMYWDFGAHLSEMKLHFGTKMTEEEYAEMAWEFAGVSLVPIKLKMWRGIVDFIWSCWTIAKISLGEDYESYLEERWNAACEVLRDLDMISL